MGEIAAVNVIPALLVPVLTENDFVWIEASAKQKQMEGQRELFDKKELMGLWG